MSKLTSQQIKEKTLELYRSLPQDEQERIKRTDIRDQLIDLNMSFFGYLAKNRYVNNTYASYEDKLQSAIMYFCDCWYWYMWEGHYRCDLSFSVFFYPRIGEMLQREYNEVKYSIRRNLCTEVGNQVGKTWGKVTLDDVKEANLSQDKLSSLYAMFGTLNPVSTNDLEPYLSYKNTIDINLEQVDYNTIEEMIIQEIIYQERQLTSTDIKRMSEMYYVDEEKILAIYPKALKMLYERLHDMLVIRSIFE